MSTLRSGAARAASLEQLRSVVDRVRPLTLAEQRVLPVLEPLAGLLPERGLRRGTLLGVGGSGAATSLALALTAEASAVGSWVATVGIDDLGLAAADELGVALERLAMVTVPDHARWATVVAALVDAFDVVLLRPPRVLPAADARRLLARARERGAVLVAVGAPLQGSEVRLHVVRTSWWGMGCGHGHLRARQVEVEVTGRRAAARPQRTHLWLPGPEGEVALVARPAGPPSLARDRVVPFPGRGITTSDTQADRG